MKKAADDLYEDYITDKELTSFTNLDLKSKDWWDTLKKEEIDSINRGLKDFEEGRIHCHDIARKVFEKYL